MPTKNSKPANNNPSLQDYIARHQMDGVLYKAQKLLATVENDILKGERFMEIAATIALVQNAVTRESYAKKIGKEYGISWPTFKKMIDDSLVIHIKKKEITRTVRKNRVAKLEGAPETFPFFTEVVTINKRTNERTFKGIQIDLKKYLELLLSFGFIRYSTESEDGFTFVRIQDNIIHELQVSRSGDPEEIKDFILDFIQDEYQFDEAGCEEVDADMLINYFLNNLKKFFSKDLFARLRSKTEVIINHDTKNECFLYFQNGFVRINKDGHQLHPYDKMDGSVWQKQMLQRDFSPLKIEFDSTEDGTEVDWEYTFNDKRPLGDYADFIWRISGQKPQRFLSLCTILGYLMHDFYNYKMKAVFLTDSLISEQSEGRTGKTLSMQMLGHIRSYCEVNGKQFSAEDEKKYQAADRSTQILHINDVMHKGKFKFYLESIFNDITEGFMVKQMYKTPFRHRAKMIVSSNKSIQIEGSSGRDRVIEFEMSSFFTENRSPQQYYGRWLAGDEWPTEEWARYDNFLCWCSQQFFIHGLVQPDTINLEARKLLDGTCREFVEFMTDIREAVIQTGTPWPDYKGSNDNSMFETRREFSEFEFDKKQLYARFIGLYPDYDTKFFSQKRFTDWLKKYAILAMGIKDPIERRSNGLFYIQFKSKDGQPPATT